MAVERFFVLDTNGDVDDGDNCLIEKFVDGINGEKWRAHQGEPLTPVYPLKARVYLEKGDKGARTSSLVGNTKSMLIMSSAMKSIIETHTQGVPIEYLALAIHDHRKRMLSDDHFLVNPLGSLDCIDLQASDVLWNEDDPTDPLDVNTIVLDRARSSQAPQLFRPKHSTFTYIMRYELAVAIQNADMTNVLFEELKLSS